MPRSGFRPIGIVAASTIWQAAGTVLLAQILTPSTATLSTFAAFGAAAVLCVLHALCSGAIPSLLRHLHRSRVVWLLFGMNVATAGVFVSFYVALAYLPPLSVSVLEAGLAPLVVSLFAAPTVENRRRSRRLFVPVAVLATSIVIAVRSLSLDESGSSTHLVGVVLACLAGLSGAGVVLLSVQLNRAGLTAVHANASRFHLAWLISGIFYLLAPSCSLVPRDLLPLAAASILLGSLPLVALQFGIATANPVASELVLASLPALVFVMALLSGEPFDLPTLGLMTVLLVIAAFSLRREAKSSRPSKSPA